MSNVFVNRRARRGLRVRERGVEGRQWALSRLTGAMTTYRGESGNRLPQAALWSPFAG